ncbi:glucose-6-phosphate dehydrogenase assembly protein OpcA [Corynebacterium otitidis]|uniref:OpcA protein n=1 Tax=Corynebacterium otitidis ATCC 51513 TaxID=883169 RepID=I7JW24_9CORY|nr:glucose-6-phosphate dehydrogenase assembly protein OpcA [Corynebacterium otitidis]EJZ82479.1 opcA protein [Corynebacterium otitidis ATCC 51513]KKO84545.1 oxppcycle protein OpcA [Corynebacterium otitidis]CCI83526.1 hypothetical protein BN46_0794 [Corynebacterium otitidis ATCC 51513]
MRKGLRDTSTTAIVETLQEIHDASARFTGRVLTLIIDASAETQVDMLTDVVSEASREHPSRVLMLLGGDGADAESRVDADIRVGGEAGASEIVLMRLSGAVANHPAAVVTPLLLPDTPIVTWWPNAAPASPAHHPLGRIAQRRITDSYTDPSPDALARRANNYRPGDSDMAWSRITQWRGQVASAVEVRPRAPIESVVIEGRADNPSIDLAAGWLAARLGVPVTRAGIAEDSIEEQGLDPHDTCRLTLRRPDGAIVLANRPGSTVSIEGPGRPDSTVALYHRTAAERLTEELRHLDPDLAYAAAVGAIGSLSYPDFPSPVPDGEA